MKRFWHHHLLIALGLLVLATTVEAAAPRRMDVRLSKEGRIFVEDEYTGIKGMVKAIKKRKADRRTTIYIEIPENTSPAAMKQITSALASESFGRIIFTKPRKFLLEETQKGSGPTASPGAAPTK